MNCRLHITKEGERWDSLAWIYYGNAYLYPKIIAANPHITITRQFSSGLTVVIPLLNSAKPSNKGLPPWME